ncbi:hypothetical protein [Endozoicomonas ascidiicola]|uniref:hypothetical protein n=1 Tax=Endozoicomonas ascidiicola TaxID=1698521 RepID=UPI0008325324|nr:hypothetical protein [Endozoicomonas ascidiicola]
MSDGSLARALEDCCLQLEQALANGDAQTLMSLDDQIQPLLKAVKAQGVTLDRQLIDRFQAVYPLMIELCTRERDHLAEQMKTLQASKTPMQAYKTVATTSVRAD